VPRVLVKEPIAEAGVQLLRSSFDVDVDVEMAAEDLPDRIGDYDALIVRSATRVTDELLAHAPRLKVIGRAGTGVDNVDVPAATRRGIIVANAPGSNMVSAAEHAVGLLLAMARNIPQAHAALKEGRWERSRFGGIEVCGKTLGVLGFGRIGQLVASRARGLGMHVIAHDPFVSPERFRETQVMQAELDELLAASDFITLHAPLTPETEHLVCAETIARMRPGVRIVNAARGGLVDLDALVDGLRSGHVAGAALDVFPDEPYTSGPIFELDNVVLTPHLGASTQEAQDRAGLIVAEQVAAALNGDVVSNAVNVPVMPAEDRELVGPFVALGMQLGVLASGLADANPERIEVTTSGALAEADTRMLTTAVLTGALSQRSDEAVNLVNARAVAEGRGIRVLESADPRAGDYTNLLTVGVVPGEAVSGTTIGRDNRCWLIAVGPHQVEIELGDNMLVMLNDDRPGMIGRVGTLLGEQSINIANMNVSRNARGEAAVMVLTIDTRPSQAALERLRSEPGIRSVRAVSLHPM
jgi:D-3-phosphoglycerate dehydrogenase